MANRLSYLLLAFVLIIFANGCGEDEDPLIENEEEVITSATLTLFPNGGQGTVTFGFSDPDGDGGDDPVFSTDGQLVANASYRGQISFANSTGAIDAEIVDEGTDHQIFYVTGSGANISFSYSDTDNLGNPIGLVTDVSTGAASNGNLVVVLRHKPMKGALGAAIDNPGSAGGSTDAQITFDFNIQ